MMISTGRGFKLEVQPINHYTDSMKNKNNVTNYSVNELVDLICELQVKKGNGDWRHSYALGTVQALLDWELKGYSSNDSTLQERVNDCYNNAKTEMDAINNGTHALQTA